MNLYILIQGLGVPLNRSVALHLSVITICTGQGEEAGEGVAELRQTKTVITCLKYQNCVAGENMFQARRWGEGGRLAQEKLVSAVRITDALGTSRFNKHGQSAAQVAGPTCQNHDRARHTHWRFCTILTKKGHAMLHR